MKKICLSLDDDLKWQLQKEAKDRHLTLNAYIRIILYGRKK